MLNVVVAAFDNNMSAKTDSIWQYDYGQILQITGIDLPEAYEVHFANLPYTGKTITQIGTADGVSIPDCLLRNGLGVYAFIFLHEGANDGETRYDIIIPVKSRPEPSDEEPTPVEQSAITEAIAALNTAVTEANDAAERAEEASSHSPYIGENGDWYIWDGESWTDSGIQAEGETGPQGPQGPKGDPGEVTQAELDAVKSDLREKASVIISSASGSIAHFEDGSESDAVDVIAYINPVQSGSGDPSPTNVRPISGFTGMNISVSDEDTTDPTVYPITFPTEAGTVYGGYVDVTNGKLVVDRGTTTVDGTQSISDNGALAYGGHQVYFTPSPTKKPGVLENYDGILSDRFRPADAIISGDPLVINGRKINGNIYFNMPSDITTADLVRTWFANNPTQVSYLLATPIEYDLTPTAVELLKGTNNIWADTGDVAVEYRADTKLYIEQLTKPTEDDMVANTNIASGKFFMIGNRLFLSTTVIASGDTINPGTNCTELSLADALNSL